MWSAVCSSAPQMHAGDWLSPQRCMLALNLPTPVRSRLSVTQSLRGSSEPAGALVSGGMVNCCGRAVPSQLFSHSWIRLKFELLRVAACREKGRRDRRRWRPRSCGLVGILCRGWPSLTRDLFVSLFVRFSRRSLGGAIPARTGRRSVGVGRRHPMMRRRVSFKAQSSFLVWVLLHHACAAYSAVLKTRASAPVRRVDVDAPHDVPARRRNRLFRAETFSRSACRCWSYVSCLSSFTPRYIGWVLYGTGSHCEQQSADGWLLWTVLRWKVYSYISFCDTQLQSPLL